MNRFPRGSEWRKWDMHVHAPGTKLNDSYTEKSGRPDLDRFCEFVHKSDVAVLAITDYFSFDGYFAVKEKYTELYADDDVLFLPNLELRLPVAVNRDGQYVNLHLIFNPDLTRELADKFLRRLNTEATVGVTRTRVTCDELSSKLEYESATVSISSIESAIRDTFGEHAVHSSERMQHLLVLASAKGDGIRAGGLGRQRKNLLSDEIDKYCDAFFANAGSRDYFLDVSRLEGDQVTLPKPVYDGCDAHSFEDLESSLGKEHSSSGSSSNITWIKADPTYAGLLQTLIEPADRVALQASRPDKKERYQVIKRVSFSGTDAFPREILFNPNLNSVIGSRSSGKSALLAFMAHAVDPAGTIKAQAEAAGFSDGSQAGPAAGFRWSDVSDTTCEVEWESGGTTSGRVIYIPQNSLYKLSEQPGEITKRISPALFRCAPDVRVAYDNAIKNAAMFNADIRGTVDEWFRLEGRVGELSSELQNLGDKDAIAAERDRLDGEIDRYKSSVSLTDAEIEEYRSVRDELGGINARLTEITDELGRLSSYVVLPTDGASASISPGSVSVSITVRPSGDDLPGRAAGRIADLSDSASDSLLEKLEEALIEAVTAAISERNSLTERLGRLQEENAPLIAKHEANDELSRLIGDHKKQVEVLEQISKRADDLSSVRAEQAGVVAKLGQLISAKATGLEALSDTFGEVRRALGDLEFNIEYDVTRESVSHATAGVSRRKANAYIPEKGGEFNYRAALADPGQFLRAIRDGRIDLRKGYDAGAVARDVLTITDEIRFSARLDGDQIGGFHLSSMTPGKQALFALTLILNESQEPWPLLIDQPEDDLDSRSIYETIVPFLTRAKTVRQIIMVSHNANLVIGADSEQVIVANRHGADRKNLEGRTFEYFSGALEHTKPVDLSSANTLGRCGIREHACEVLDGGEEAFVKRREKYRIRSAG